MAELPHTFPGYINVEETQFKAGVSEYLAQKLGRIANFLADKDFTIAVLTSGTSWSKPSSTIKSLLVWGSGGGGGGGGSNAFGVTPPTESNGAGGAGAPFLGPFPYDVTSISTVAYAIGTGGAGGAYQLGTNGVNGSNGGNTTFGPFTFPGGYGGQGAQAIGGGGGTTSPGSKSTGADLYDMGYRNNSWFFPAGSGGEAGGGSSYGQGAAAGAAAAANTGAGGGGGLVSGGSGQAGGSGIIILAYLNG